jgi:hypothetical protein
VCSFTDKARRAAEAGAVGLVIADYPLSSKPSDEAGLVRPAPSSESDDDDEADHGDLDLVVVLMPHSSAVAVRSIMNGTVVTVEPELYEEDDILDATGYEGPVGAAAAAADPTAILDDLPREGRLVVNDHEIINMRVVELCKQPFY